MFAIAERLSHGLKAVLKAAGGRLPINLVASKYNAFFGYQMKLEGHKVRVTRSFERRRGSSRRTFLLVGPGERFAATPRVTWSLRYSYDGVKQLRSKVFSAEVASSSQYSNGYPPPEAPRS